MRLFINGRFLTQRVSGVQSFAREICRELAKETELTILIPANEPLIDDEFSPFIKKIGKLKGHLWEQIDLTWFMNNQKEARLLNLCNTGPLFLQGQIVTIHDLAFLKNPAWFNRVFSITYSIMVPRLVRSASTVITVSETVKAEICSQYGVSSQKVIVLSNKVGIDLLNEDDIPPFDERLVPTSYFLMVGSNNPRKNFNFVEKLFSENNISHILVIAGGSFRSFNTDNTMHFQNDRIIRLDYINNQKLKWLYKNAKAFINPSLYEGFGIPNIEAMAFGCPVICSDIPVFREVCKEAAFYFNLLDISTLKKCVTGDIEQHELVAEKISIGKEVYMKYQHEKRLPALLNAVRK